MKKKVLTVTLFVLVASLTAGITYLLLLKRNHRQKIERDIPDVRIATIGGDSVRLLDVTEDLPKVLMYFSTDCEYCEAVIKDFLKNDEKFNSVQVIFVSTEPQEDVEPFLKVYPIDKFRHSIVLLDERLNLAKELDIQSPPTWFVYDSVNHLLKTSMGATTSKHLLDIISGSNGNDR